MEIKIRLDSMAEQKIYEINYKENLFTINGEIVDRSAIEIYKKLINIIKDWKESLEDLNIQDGLSCHISYNENGEQVNLKFINNFPEGFEEMLEILEGVEIDG